MPTIYEQRCLNCGRHGHDKTECDTKKMQKEPHQVNHSIHKQSNDLTHKCEILYGKEEVDNEIKAEESLMNY